MYHYVSAPRTVACLVLIGCCSPSLFSVVRRPGYWEVDGSAPGSRAADPRPSSSPPAASQIACSPAPHVGTPACMHASTGGLDAQSAALPEIEIKALAYINASRAAAQRHECGIYLLQYCCAPLRRSTAFLGALPTTHRSYSAVCTTLD